MFHPFVETIKQRGKADCCIAALAMLLGRTYEDVLAAAITKKHPQPHATGMYTLRQLQATARRLGIALLELPECVFMRDWSDVQRV